MTPDEIDALAQALSERLRPSTGAVDWAAVRIPRYNNRRPVCAELDEQAMVKLQFIAEKSYGGSLSGVVKTAVYYYLAEKWCIHMEALEAIAAREGLAIEECLSRVVDGTLDLYPGK